MPVAAALLLAAALAPRAAPAAPKLVFWAWERDEDLGAVDPALAQVAILTATVRVDRAESWIVRRRQPVRIPEGVVAWSVVRLEARDVEGAPLARVAELVLEGFRPGSAGLQLDFDSTLSQRAFHRALLQELRARLPEGVPLSITALASWCADDDWLTSLPEGTIDHAVPMLFDAGPDTARLRERVERGTPWRCALCRDHLGVADTEPLLPGRPPATTWWFSMRAWTPESVRAVQEGAGP